MSDTAKRYFLDKLNYHEAALGDWVKYDDYEAIWKQLLASEHKTIALTNRAEQAEARVRELEAAVRYALGCIDGSVRDYAGKLPKMLKDAVADTEEA